MVLNLKVDSLASGSETEKKKRSPGNSSHHHLVILGQDHILAQVTIITTYNLGIIL